MTTIRRSMLLLLIYCVGMWAMATPAAAQFSPNPDIDIQCSPSAVPMDVYPGASRTGTTFCTATNPTAYAEVVRITVTAGGLTYAAPGSITVPGGQDVTFEITVRGDQRMPEGSRTVSITGIVDSANGVPVQSSTPKTTSIMVIINQFSRLRVEAEEPFKQLRPKVDYVFEFSVFNDGNAYDRFSIEVANRDKLEDSDFQISLPQVSTEIEAQAPADKMRVMVRTPKKQGWSDEYYQLQFKATSEFSLRSEGIANYQTQMVTIYIRGIYLPGFELIPSMMMIGIAIAVISRRSQLRREEDAEGEAESAPVLLL
jgi:hypothetical protein